MRRLALYFLLDILLLSVFVASREEPAPFYQPGEYDLVPNEYIVILHQNHTLQAHFSQVGINLSNTSGFMEIEIIHGYLAHLEDATVQSLIRFDPGVILVEQNSHFRPVENVVPIFCYEEDDFSKTSCSVKPRLDRRQFRSFSDSSPWWIAMMNAGREVDAMGLEYQGGQGPFIGAGRGVNVYIFNGGVRITHQIFLGEATNIKNGAPSDISPYVDEQNEDFNGHGTQVAAIVWHNAPWTRIVSVKIFRSGPDVAKKGRLGNTANLLQAINDVFEEHIAFRKEKPFPEWKGSVINLSVEVPSSKALEYAFANAFMSGIPIVAAAGNDDTDVPNPLCSYFGVMCVASCDAHYRKSSFSNYGKDVHFIAPGEDILSWSAASDTAYDWRSGTSMAAPAVAAMLAIFVSYESLSYNAFLAVQRLLDNAVMNITSGFSEETPNRLANSGLNNPDKGPGIPYKGAPYGEGGISIPGFGISDGDKPMQCYGSVLCYVEPWVREIWFYNGILAVVALWSTAENLLLLLGIDIMELNPIAALRQQLRSSPDLLIG
ncbi:MAG: hypothetical protein Q9227_004193 [Pyrenula ochraceoflavens]